MAFTRKPTLLLSLAFLSACASSSEDYPSLAQHSAERVNGSFNVPQNPEYTLIPPASVTLERAGELARQANAAHQAFLAEAPAAQGAVNAADGTSLGSEPWSIAHVAIARLQAHQSGSRDALVSLDRIFLEAANVGESLDEIGQQRDQVAAIVAQEDQLIDALLAVLAQ